MTRIINKFKNYLLNKSNQYRYYKSENMRLKHYIAHNKQISDIITENLKTKDDLNKKIDKLEIKLLNSLKLQETLLEEILENSGQDKKFCPICNSEVNAFLPFGQNLRKNAMCPNCNSLERHRLSYLFLKEKTNIFEEENIKILHFAPEAFFSKRFSNQENIDYLPVDLNPDKPGIKEKMDIQDIKYPDNTFNFIYCSHVLEHVPNDQKAIKELHRVLKPGGTALIMVPIKHLLKETYEDASINTPELRLKHYGQSDHLRYYGLDFQEILEKNGFNCSKYSKEEFDEKSIKKYGLKNGDLFYCTK